MLEIRDLVAAYGPIVALRGVSLRVPSGQIVTILGANGAGKSTTLQAVAGLIRPVSGVIEMDGRRIDRTAPESIVKRGIALVPEGRQLFPTLTVEQNLRLGAYTRKDRDAVKGDMEKVYGYFPGLLRHRKGPHGQAQAPAPGRAVPGPGTAGRP